MKTILRVAKTELRTLFYSPIAWFLLIVFLVQCGIIYVGGIDGAARMQEMRGATMAMKMSLTDRIFLSKGALFQNVMEKLYLYIPLLTMSLISREINSGTIRLLYSSPVRVREIVFGKYLAMLVYNLLLVLVIGFFVTAGTFQIAHAEIKMLLSGLLGFFLLLSAYAAIGLFMSSLSTYQVVAAISTFVMIGILSYVGTLWQRIPFVRELTYYMSINGRAQKMLEGLLTTKDVIYFLVIIYIFLGLSIYKLKSGMESKPAIVKVSRYVAIVISALLIGYVTSLPALTGYYDATTGQAKTLTPKVQKILKDLGDEPLEVTAYANLLDNYYWLGGPDSYNMTRPMWEPYQRFKENIILKTVSYYDSTDNDFMWKAYPGKNLDEMAKQYAKNQEMDIKSFKTPAEIHKLIDLKPEQNRYVMQLKWKGRTTFLRVFDDQGIWPGETEVAAALKRLQQAQLPKIAFLTGDLERDINKIDDKDYMVLTVLPTFRNSLVNQGFDVDTVSLETQEVPADISTLVVADPKIALRPVTMAKLQQYISKGGNLLIAGEPGRQEILNPLLQQLGVQLMAGRLIQEDPVFTPEQVTPDLSKLAASFSVPLAQRAADSQKVFMPGVAGLTFASDGAYKIQPLLTSNANFTWNRVKPLDLDMVSSAATNNTGGSTSRTAAGTVSFSAEDGDVKGPIPTMVALTRQVNGREQRIIVAGDADFISYLGLKRSRMANFVLATGMFSWLSYGSFPIDASRPDPIDLKVTVTPDNVAVLRIIYLWVLPGILLAFGAILLIRRKRK